MKILRNLIDQKSESGEMTLIASNGDDIYSLSLIISEGDRVKTVTTRKVSFDGGKTQQKIVCQLEIRVETITADLVDGIIYIKGKVSQEHEHINIGSYHTLNIPIDHKLTIKKDNWSHIDIKTIKDATHESPELCFIVFFAKDCVVSLVSASSIKILSKHDPKPKNFKSINNGLSGLKSKVKTFVIASISEIRNDFFKAFSKDLKHLVASTIVLKLPSEYKNISNTKTISKILTDKAFVSSFSEVKYVEDLQEINEFFIKLDRQDSTLFIGEGEVNEAFEYGAVKTLFITDELYRPKTIEERQATELIVKEAAELRAKICVIPVSHEHGEKLKKLGGIAGISLFSYR